MGGKDGRKKAWIGSAAHSDSVMDVHGYVFCMYACMYVFVCMHGKDGRQKAWIGSAGHSDTLMDIHGHTHIHTYTHTCIHTCTVALNLH